MNDGVEASLQRAREHLGRAALEGLLAVRALMEATYSASGLDSAAPDSLAGELERGLDALIESLRNGKGVELPSVLADPLIRALGAEIERWEERSQSDSTARPILRALLGLREILWELGLRPSKGTPSPEASENNAWQTFDPTDWPDEPTRGSSPFARAEARNASPHDAQKIGQRPATPRQKGPSSAADSTGTREDRREQQTSPSTTSSFDAD